MLEYLCPTSVWRWGEWQASTCTAASGLLYILCLVPTSQQITTASNGEACDDGNTVSGDGCDSECVVEYCGDSIANNNGEVCDDANTDEEDGCLSTCAPPRCGDEVSGCSSVRCALGRGHVG